MQSALQVELSHVRDIPVLSIGGEMRLDLAVLERELNRLAAGRPPVVVLDLSGLSFISSLGMGLLNSFRRGLHSHGGITRIAAAQPDVATALRLCSLDKLYEMHDSLDAALAPSVAATPQSI
jgi:anti-sigma B factor antagonist